VLKFAPGLDPKALQWLIKKIKAPKDAGGGDLLLRRQPGCDDKQVNKYLNACEVFRGKEIVQHTKR